MAKKVVELAEQYTVVDWKRYAEFKLAHPKVRFENIAIALNLSPLLVKMFEAEWLTHGKDIAKMKEGAGDERVYMVNESQG